MPMHQNKMIIECAQLLSTAHHVLDGENAIEGIYKQTHVNHPCAKWVRESSGNYNFVRDLASYLCMLFFERTGRLHATEEILSRLVALPKNLVVGPETDMTPYACVSGAPGETVYEKYRNYLNDKFYFWKKEGRKISFYRTPEWYNPALFTRPKAVKVPEASV
ncbi:hypothetical protein [Escherichia phage vB_EcoM_IME392]|nr:hypothetical protein [Escherichia phage vB_EcoM_IME392]